MSDRESGRLSHLKLNAAAKSQPYTYPYNPFDQEIQLRTRSRKEHANELLGQIQTAKTLNEKLKAVRVNNELFDDGTYLELKVQVPVNKKDVLLSLQDDRLGIEIVNILNEREITIDGSNFWEYVLTIFIPGGRIENFIKKFIAYKNKDTKHGKPRNLRLISSIEEIKLATLKSFWVHQEVPFPEDKTNHWWEVWFRTTNSKIELSNVERIKGFFAESEIKFSDQYISFPEHSVFLIESDVKTLSDSLVFLNSLAELRVAKPLTSFYTEYLNYTERESWVEDLVDRISTNEPKSTICILDSGINNGNPILEKVIPDSRLDTINRSWGSNDTYPSPGHGTMMAGTALYGDLTDVMSTINDIDLYHDLESVKIFEITDENDPDLYGSVTQRACDRAIVMDNGKKIFCLAVTSMGLGSGKPSSWSAAIDNLIYDSISKKNAHLFFISGGNVKNNQPGAYPLKNNLSSIENPGQSWNSLTVGTYTDKSIFDSNKYPGNSLLVNKGGMGFVNSTSLLWDSDWPYKPDFVLEGGNFIHDGVNVNSPDDLQILSTRKDFRLSPIGTFGDTSAATAEASRLAAKIYEEYPEFWPETVRGLLVHSSEWTDEMLNMHELKTKKEVQHLIRKVGYGVPSLEKARYSAKNSLTLISEAVMQPFKKEKGTIKTNELHYYELP